jgi:hypothetical protein
VGLLSDLQLGPDDISANLAVSAVVAEIIQAAAKAAVVPCEV